MNRKNSTDFEKGMQDKMGDLIDILVNFKKSTEDSLSLDSSR